MAGWSKRVDGSGLKSYLEEVNGLLHFRPFPPMVGDGKVVDLLKLYLVVREKGEYHRVCESGSWGVVAKDCGFDSSFGLALKLVYVKYLDELERVMVRLEHLDDEKSGSGCGGSVQTDLQLDLKEALMKISDEKKKDEKKCIDEKMSVKLNGDVQGGVGDIELVKLSGDKEDCITRKRKYSDENMSVGDDEEHSKCVNGNEDAKCGKDDIDEEGGIARKRKRESYLDMLKWVTNVAKDPCDPAIGHLPERYKWKSYGNEVVWKKILLLRDEMLLERNADIGAQLSVWQQKQKMHPSMYDDNTGSERLRCSQRVLSAKDSMKKTRLYSISSSSGSHIDGTLIDGPNDSSAESGVWWNRRRKKVVSIGSEFQADIPEWKSDIYESDSKWLGTQIWPLDKTEQRKFSIERDPLGKGRQDTCGCEHPGSYNCITFHLFEKNRKVKLELGSAFYHWKFDCIGEKAALSWTKEDEQKFQDIVKSSPPSEDENFSFWTELFKFFPHKSRESLVRYYFNVYLLRQRGHQNRMNASDIDSDDDESGYGPRSICFGRDKFSILCSPKKAHLDTR